MMLGSPHRPERPMFIHIVHFWLKPDLTAAQRAEFLAGLRAVAKSPNVETVRIGTPAPTDGKPRPVVDDTYDYQLYLDEPHTAAAKKENPCFCGSPRCRKTLLRPKR